VDPQQLLYSETHEWAHVEDQGEQKLATVGISAFAVEQLTDIVFLELPPVGKELEPGAEFGEVESVKAVSPLYSPVAGPPLHSPRRTGVIFPWNDTESEPHALLA
jgi:glycine cleavage system H protein